jgi:NAD(P)H dehydrogenase (quinone)
VNALLVFSHPEPRSFCGALRNTTAARLTGAGHQVDNLDLYSMRFKAVAGRDDFAHVDSSFFKYQAEQCKAQAAGDVAADIGIEQQSLPRADPLVLHFPLWWFGMPPIREGWFDRVLAVGSAYGGSKRFDKGVFRGKRALIATTKGGKQDRFCENGLFGPMDSILHPLRVGRLYFCGDDTLEPLIAWGAASASEAKRSEYLAAWHARPERIEAEAPQPFRRLAEFPAPAMRDH